MPTKTDFDKVAKKLLAKGRPVSLRNVHAGLKDLVGAGGSNRELGPMLTAWKDERDYRPKLGLKGLPERLQASFGAVATAMWTEAQSEAAARSVIEAENHAAALGARDAVLDEALASLDAAQAELAGLRERVAVLERQQRRVKAWDYWDAVMREVFELMPDVGTSRAEELLPDIRPTTIRGAALQHEDLSVENLREKMRGRASQGWYFIDEEDGNFRRGIYPGTMRRRAGPA